MPEATAPRPYSWLPVLIGVLTVIMLTIGTHRVPLHRNPHGRDSRRNPSPLQPPKSRTNWTDFSLNGMAMR